MTDLPMLAIGSTGASGRKAVSIESLAGTHVFDTKLDGIRAFCYFDGTTMRLVNRKGVDITRKFPEISGVRLPAPVWLDGEIVADDGSFESTLTRDKQEKATSIARLAQTTPCRFVAFDVPEFAQSRWTLRRELLELLAGAWTSDRFTISPISEDPAFFELVAAQGMEGVIAKRKTSRYQFDKRSADWVKFKATQRITCLVRGYEPGQGARAHFGAMQLNLVDKNLQLVDVGRVGSGFSVRDTHTLKARLDAGEVLIVEIECLSLSSGGTLRFPVYRGVRTDVDVLDCTTDQLATLPRS